MTHQEVCDKIGTLQTQAEDIVTRNATVEEWTSEDKTKFDNLHADMKKFREQKRRLDLQLEVKAELEQTTRQSEPNEIRKQQIGRASCRERVSECV